MLELLLYKHMYRHCNCQNFGGGKLEGLEGKLVLEKECVIFFPSQACSKVVLNVPRTRVDGTASDMVVGSALCQ